MILLDTRIRVNLWISKLCIKISNKLIAVGKGRNARASQLIRYMRAGF